MDNKLTGKVFLEKINKNTNEILETYEECNDISIMTLMQSILGLNGADSDYVPKRVVGTPSYTWKIFWSKSNIHQSILTSGIPIGNDTDASLMGDGVDVNIGSPYYTQKILPGEKNYLTFIADILPPDSGTREIKSLSIGQTKVTSLYSSSYECNMLTNLNLTTSCIQDSVTVIRVTYRIYIDDPIPSPIYSEFSDNTFTYLSDYFKYISDGSTTDNWPVTYKRGNVMYSSSFYDPSTIDNYKPLILSSDYPDYCSKFSDMGVVNNGFNLSQTIYHNNIQKFNINRVLNDNASCGCFFKTINIGSTYKRRIGSSIGIEYRRLYEADYSYMYRKILPANVTPIKNVFKQILNAPGPFQELSYIGTMTGSITLDASAWVSSPLPKLVQVDITATGTETSATYKYKVGTFAGGFIGNTYNPREIVLPQDGWSTKKYHRQKVQDNNILDFVSFGGTTVRSPDNTKYFVTTSCLRNKDSISYYNIETGNKYILNATTTPSLPVTNTSDMAVSNGYTFVTCANTGLWQISPDFNTVTHLTSIGGSIDATKAYQIDVKDNGDLWVLFEGGLAKGTTSNSGVSWTWTVYDTTSSPAFSATGITNANWSNVTSMTVDPVHANDRILFVLGNASSTNSYAAAFIWWERLTGTTTIMTTGVSYPSFSLAENLKRSDLIRCANGTWFTSDVSHLTDTFANAETIYLASFSNLTWTTKTSQGGVDGRVLPITLNGISGVLFGNIGSQNLTSLVYDNEVDYGYSRYTSFFVKDSNISSLPSTFTLGMSQIEFYLRNGAMDSITTDLRVYPMLFNAAYPSVYLSNSNMLVSYNMSVNAFSFSPIIPPKTAVNYSQFYSIFWKEYGWDGASWVLGNSNSKTCHTVFQPLLDGIDIKFTNGTSGTNFINTENFIFVVGDGIMKDNATQLDTNIAMFAYDSENITDLYTPTNSQITTVPNHIYGSVTDELVTFRPQNHLTTNLTCLTANGQISHIGGNYTLYLSCQRINENTEFTLKFKLKNNKPLFSNNGPSVFLLLELFTGVYNYGSNTKLTIGFRNNSSSNSIYIYNGNTSSTVIGTIAESDLSISKEFLIRRTKNNDILVYYDNILYAKTNFSGELYISGNAPSSGNGSDGFKGYYDIKLSYTDYRRMALFGHQTNLTSKFNNKFLCTMVNNTLNNIKCTINNIPQTVLFTHSSDSVLTQNQVRIESGAGYLIFTNMPTITVSTSSATTLPSLYPIINGGVITSIVIDKNGSGFTSTPTITISPPLVAGTTATATVTLDATNSVNDLVTITNAGAGYTMGVYPLVITGGGGTGATGNVHIGSSGTVLSVEILTGGTNYTSAPTLSFTGAGTPTTTAVLTAAIGKRISSITVTDGGTNYLYDAGTTVTANTIALYTP